MTVTLYAQNLASEESTNLLVCIILFSAYCSLWILRKYGHNLPKQRELTLSICYLLWGYRTHIRAFLESIQANSVWFLSVASLSFCILISHVLYTFNASQLLISREPNRNAENVQPVEDDLLGHQIFPSQTTHTRFFPKKHSFKYSYLLVGIPLPAEIEHGSCTSSRTHDQSIEQRDRPKVWFDVRPQNHLGRDGTRLSLRAKLDNYLSDQGENPSAYPFAYLVTAPTFLGYSFNPVSFWYLYDKKQALKSMILEVNNTFDERRMYLLRQDGQSSKPDADNSITTRPKSFTNSWPKDFHVSPFNSRKGAYSLKAEDIVISAKEGSAKVSNVITLESSKEHAKLVASIRSTAPGINARYLSNGQKARFLLSWWWVGFVTYPRIVKEAAKLFFKRKLHVWYRPEVMPTSVGRRANACEQAVEALFCQWLQAKVEASPLEQSLRYDPVALGYDIKPTFEPKSIALKSRSQDTVTFKPTTPLFYSAVATASNTERFLNSCVQCTDTLKLVLYTDRPEAIQEIIFTESREPSESSGKARRLSWLCRFRWSLIPVLRGFRKSQMDHFAISQGSREADEYRKATLKLLLANRVALGLVEIIDLAIFLINVWAFSKSVRAALILVLSIWSSKGEAPWSQLVVPMFTTHIVWLVDVIS